MYGSGIPRNRITAAIFKRQKSHRPENPLKRDRLYVRHSTKWLYNMDDITQNNVERTLEEAFYSREKLGLQTIWATGSVGCSIR